jgi:hypothetical protein
MNAPTHNPPAVGSVEELRRYAAECLGMVRVFAGHAEDYAQHGMDEQLVITTRKMIAATKAAALTVRDLHYRQNQGEAGNAPR